MRPFGGTFGVGGLVQLGTNVNPSLPDLKNLVANNDIVLVNDYQVGRGQLIDGRSASSIEQINVYPVSTIRQHCTINKLRIWITQTNSSITSFYFKIWRKNSGTYNLVGQSDDLSPNFTLGGANWYSINLTTPIPNVKEGDYVGYYATLNGSTATFMGGNIGYAEGSLGIGYEVLNSASATDGFNWEAQTKLINNDIVPKLEVSAQSPVFVALGNSIVAGHPDSYSLIEGLVGLSGVALNTTIAYNLGSLMNYTYQNMGKGGQNTSEVLARFDLSVTASNPKFAILEIDAINDAQDGFTATQTVNNMISMIDLCVANNIIPVVLAVTPWGGTTDQMRQNDSVNNQMAAICSSRRIYFVNANSYIGTFRTGGDAGNLWDVKSIYTTTDIWHLNPLGYKIIAYNIYHTLGGTLQTPTSLTVTTGVLKNTVIINETINTEIYRDDVLVHTFTGSGEQTWVDTGLEAIQYSYKTRASMGGAISPYSDNVLATPTSGTPIQNLLADGNTIGAYLMSNVTKDVNDKMTLWPDDLGSGRNFAQSDVAKSPTWSASGLLFDGVDDFMKFTYGFLQPFTVYMVLSNVTNVSGKYIISGGLNNAFKLLQAGSNQVWQYSGNYGTKLTFTTGSVGILTAGYDGSVSSFIQKNANTPTTGFNVGTLNPTGLVIGAFYNGTVDFGNFYIKEMIVRSCIDNDTNKAIVRDYLNAKYSVY